MRGINSFRVVAMQCLRFLLRRGEGKFAGVVPEQRYCNMIKPASAGYLFLLFYIKNQKVVIDFLLAIVYGRLARKVTFLAVG